MTDYKKQLIERSKVAYEVFLPHLSIDTVIFGFHDGKLKVLLLKMNFNKEWFLPGGFVYKNEDLDEAAKSVLKRRAGVENVFLKEFAVFGQHNRSQKWFDEFDDPLWHKQRFVTVGYYALVDYTEVIPIADEISERCEWKLLSEVEQMQLTMDHRAILARALKTLREDVIRRPVGYNLLPETFTMPELQLLYEVILNRKLNRGNFYRKILRYGVMEAVGVKKTGQANKSPILYRLIPERYEEALEKGFYDKNGI